jgi:hypothetical protein
MRQIIIIIIIIVAYAFVADGSYRPHRSIFGGRNSVGAQNGEYFPDGADALFTRRPATCQLASPWINDGVLAERLFRFHSP